MFFWFLSGGGVCIGCVWCDGGCLWWCGLGLDFWGSVFFVVFSACVCCFLGVLYVLSLVVALGLCFVCDFCLFFFCDRFGC